MDELEISGKRYISARRAAKENKYTPDYIGQLIRGGKITGQKVGRAWYVSEESLTAYLRGEMLTTSGVASVPVVKQEVVAQKETPIEKVVVETVVPIEVETQTKESKEIKKEKEEVAEVKEEDEKEAEVKIEEEIPVPLVKISAREVEEVHDEYIEEETPERQTGLRYIADDTMPFPTLEKKISTEPEPLYIVPQENAVTLRRSDRRGIMPLVTLGLLGVSVLVVSAVISSRMVSQIQVQGSGPANIVWALK